MDNIQKRNNVHHCSIHPLALFRFFIHFFYFNVSTSHIGPDYMVHEKNMYIGSE